VKFTTSWRLLSSRMWPRLIS